MNSVWREGDGGGGVTVGICGFLKECLSPLIILIVQAVGRKALLCLPAFVFVCVYHQSSQFSASPCILFSFHVCGLTAQSTTHLFQLAFVFCVCLSG